MKRIVCFVLSLLMLLTLCACGTTEPATEPSTLPSTEPTTEPATEPTTVPTTAPTAPTTEPTEPVFEPIAIYDDAKYGTVQVTDLYSKTLNETPCVVAVFTVTNNSDSVLQCRFGEAVYINDMMCSPRELAEYNNIMSSMTFDDYSFDYTVKIEKGQTQTFGRVLSVGSRIGMTVDVSVNITYDNGEIGVYNEKIELVNELFRIHTEETAASDKYIVSGNELFTADSDAYKLIVTDYGEKQEFGQKRYWVSVYLENTSKNDVTFGVEDIGFDNLVRASSDKQDNVRYMNVFLNCNLGRVTLAPGKGFHLVVEVDKEDVDCLALDASEVITLNIPIFAWDGSDDGRTYTWKDRHVVQVTRDQLVHGINEPAPEPTTAPTTEPAPEPTATPATEPAPEPTTAPPTEPAPDSSDSEEIPNDPGDVGNGGTEEIPDDPGDIGHGGAPEVGHTHSYTVAAIKNPTCTNPGYTAYTCYCGDTYMGDHTDPTGHDYEDTVVEPTTESEGYTEHYCWKCGDSYRDNYTDKLPA